MKNNFTKNCLAILFVFLITIPSFAGKDNCKKEDKCIPRGSFGMENDIMKKLSLTTEQEKQMEDNRSKHEENCKTISEALKAKHEILQKELEKKNHDQTLVDKTVAEIKDLSNQMIDARIQSIIDMKTILTEDQLKKLNEMKAKHREKREKEMKKHDKKKWNKDKNKNKQ